LTLAIVLPQAPLISYLIVVRNMNRTIRQCLNSVVLQGQAEVVVVDGHSMDGTTEIIDEFKVLHLYDSVCGPSAARNLGLKQTTGQYLVILDGDQTLDLGFQNEVLNLIQSKTPDVITHKGIYLAKDFWSNCYRLERALSIRVNTILGLGGETPDIRIVKRSLVYKLGGWDSSMFAFEDLDLWHRLKEQYSGDLRITSTQKAVIYSDEIDVNPIIELKRGIFYGRGLIRYIQKRGNYRRLTLLPPLDLPYSFTIFVGSLYKTQSLKEAFGVFLLRSIRSAGYLWGSMTRHR
jgi:glycosyltransferase involved in cell wall biosynthesis